MHEHKPNANADTVIYYGGSGNDASVIHTAGHLLEVVGTLRFSPKHLIDKNRESALRVTSELLKLTVRREVQPDVLLDHVLYLGVTDLQAFIDALKQRTLP